MPTLQPTTAPTGKALEDQGIGLPYREVNWALVHAYECVSSPASELMFRLRRDDVYADVPTEGPTKLPTIVPTKLPTLAPSGIDIAIVTLVDSM